MSKRPGSGVRGFVLGVGLLLVIAVVATGAGLRRTPWAPAIAGSGVVPAGADGGGAARPTGRSRTWSRSRGFVRADPHAGAHAHRRRHDPRASPGVTPRPAMPPPSRRPSPRPSPKPRKPWTCSSRSPPEQVHQPGGQHHVRRRGAPDGAEHVRRGRAQAADVPDSASTGACGSGRAAATRRPAAGAPRRCVSALDAYGVQGYELRAYQSRGFALRDAARILQRDAGRP